MSHVVLSKTLEAEAVFATQPQKDASGSDWSEDITFPTTYGCQLQDGFRTSLQIAAMVLLLSLSPQLECYRWWIRSWQSVLYRCECTMQPTYGLGLLLRLHKATSRLHASGEAY